MNVKTACPDNAEALSQLREQTVLSDEDCRELLAIYSNSFEIAVKAYKVWCSTGIWVPVQLSSL